MAQSPILLWFRRDLRLADHPMVVAAAATGRPLIPIFILDEVSQNLGAAARWRLGLALETFASNLEVLGCRLILRKGSALAVLQKLIGETGADTVFWSRSYIPNVQERDRLVKTALKAKGLNATSFDGHLLFEPWRVATQEGGFYRVYTPFWKSVARRDVPTPVAAPKALHIPSEWPQSAQLREWRLDAPMNRSASILYPYQAVGEAAALRRLELFMAGPIGPYKEARDFPEIEATSRLSENLTYGEISPRLLWHSGQRAMRDGAAGAEHFLKELVWREFAYHLCHHTPHILTRNWRPEWDAFPWRDNNDDAEKWRRGMTGEPFVDAAMREMYVTGSMHNRGRMIVASYLTKHLMTDWRVGMDWFEQCLTDWDPAANAMGWQWAAGSGPDASPYFRIFNPERQAERFDPNMAYRKRYIAELSTLFSPTAHAFFEAAPRTWQLDSTNPYPDKIIDLSIGRTRALAAYSARGS
jgi:deoxyribodipyrimidine photo-lyase